MNYQHSCSSAWASGDGSQNAELQEEEQVWARGLTEGERQRDQLRGTVPNYNTTPVKS